MALRATVDRGTLDYHCRDFVRAVLQEHYALGEQCTPADLHAIIHVNEHLFVDKCPGIETVAKWWAEFWEKEIC